VLERCRWRRTSSVAVTVVVVTWQGAHLLPTCLRSLSAQTVPHQVLLVDNGSTDGTRDLVIRDYPGVQVLWLDRNTGFAGGVSAALSQIRTPYFALLNNDAAAEPDWLERSLATLDADESIAAVTARMLLWRHDAESPGMINNAGVNLVSGGYGADRGLHQPDAPPFDEPVEVFGFSGGAAVLRTCAVQAVGGMPAQFFLYYEDTDLSWRLRLAGWRIRYEASARVYHRHGATSSLQSDLFAYYNERNRLLMLLRCAPAAFAIRQAARFCATTVSLQLRRLVGQPVPNQPTFRLSVRLRVLRGVLRLAPWALVTRREIARRSTIARSTLANDWMGRAPG
jgi:GT2 family glycosyltransferase